MGGTRILYRHSGVSTSQLYIDTVAEGTVIEIRATSCSPESAGLSHLRGAVIPNQEECRPSCDAGERFCKEVLVNDQRSKGNAAPSLTDYEGR